MCIFVFVQVAPGDSPGQYILWSMVNEHSLQPIRVNIKRDIYINSGECEEIQALVERYIKKLFSLFV